MRSPVAFAMIPTWVFTSGMLTSWSHATAKVYLGLCAFVNGKTRLAYPSLRKLSTLTRISRTTVSACLTDLWRCGAIEVRRIGMKSVNCYFLPLDPSKCPSNLDAYLRMKPIRQSATAKRLASKQVGRGVVKLLGRRTRVSTNKNTDTPLRQPVQTIIQNIIQVKTPATVETERVRP